MVHVVGIRRGGISTAAELGPARQMVGGASGRRSGAAARDGVAPNRDAVGTPAGTERRRSATARRDERDARVREASAGVALALAAIAMVIATVGDACVRPTERRVTARGRLPRRRRPHRDNLATRNAPVGRQVPARPGRQIPNRHPLGESRRRCRRERNRRRRDATGARGRRDDRARDIGHFTNVLARAPFVRAPSGDRGNHPPTTREPTGS